MARTEDSRQTESGIEIRPVYGDGEQPGDFPFTRGPYRDMYRGRPWTIRQYAGFSSAEETNIRFRYLLDRGQTGLSVAFDLPTQLGYDSDDPHAVGEVGRTGVAIDSLEDMRLLFADQLVKKEEQCRRRVDRHRRGDVAQGDLVEEQLHVGDRVDRDARAPDLADGPRVVGVVPELRREVEGDRETRLSALEQVAEPLVRLGGRAEACVLPNRPRPAAVHVLVRPTGERVLAR